MEDGLASGYTMVAVVPMVENLTPEKNGGCSARDLIEPLVDDLVRFHVQEHGGFAVASYYIVCPELSDEEALELPGLWHV